MILLTSVQTLQVVLSAAITTSQLTYTTGYVDEDTTTYVITPGASDGATNSTSAVTMVAAPNTGFVRRVTGFSIFNADTVASILTVQLIDNGTTRTIWKGLLLDGDTLFYSDLRGFYIINSSGELRVNVSNIASSSSSSGSSSVPAHATSHESGGTDPIPLDLLAAPSDTTNLNASSTTHGLSPKSPADATKFLNGAATPAYAQVKDSDLSLSDITTNNATASQHGFIKKLSGAVAESFRGDGTFSSSLLAANLTGTITSATQDLITRLGTIASGVWNGTKIGLAYGGTNADLSATGGSNQLLKQASSGAAITVGTIASANLSDTANIPLLNANQTFTGTGNTAFNGNVAFGTTFSFKWVAKSLNTAYLAASDGFVVGSCISATPGDTLTVLSDAANPPTVGRTSISDGGGNSTLSYMCPVKQGDYYKVVTTGTMAAAYGPFWVPNGFNG